MIINSGTIHVKNINQIINEIQNLTFFFALDVKWTKSEISYYDTNLHFTNVRSC